METAIDNTPVETKPKINPNREKLKALSAAVKEAVNSEEFATVNEALKALYAKQGHTEVNTLHQWNEHGYTVKKGEKALLLWGSPKDKSKVNEAKAQGKSDEEIQKFFPVCYVFSQLQVKPKE